MYAFILSTILVTIISLCIFKNRFWVNRYLIMLIIAATSLISMTIINFSVRSNLPHMVDINTSKELISFYSNIPKDTTCVDTIIPNFGKVVRIPRTYHLLQNDSIEQIKSHIIFYKYDNSTYVGWNTDNNKRVNRIKLNRIYFGVSDNPRYEVRVLRHDASNTLWVNRFSLPDIKTIAVLYIPQHEYEELSLRYELNILPF